MCQLLQQRLKPSYIDNQKYFVSYTNRFTNPNKFAARTTMTSPYIVYIWGGVEHRIKDVAIPDIMGNANSTQQVISVYGHYMDEGEMVNVYYNYY